MTMNPVGHDMRVDFRTDTACFSTIMKLGETNGGTDASTGGKTGDRMKRQGMPEYVQEG